MIKAIIFDWGGVVIEAPEKERFGYIAQKLNVAENDFLEALRLFESDFRKGIISEDEFWDRICKELKVPKPKQKSLWTDALKPYFKEKKDVIAVMRQLRNGGFRIGLLSDSEKPVVETFFTERQRRIFDAVVFSCFEGMTKGERRIFEIAFEQLRINPQEAVYIDDKPRFIEMAVAMGANGIVFRDSDQLRKELEVLGIKLKK